MDVNRLGAGRGVALTLCIWLHVTRRKTGLTCKRGRRTAPVDGRRTIPLPLFPVLENKEIAPGQTSTQPESFFFKIASKGFGEEFYFSAPEKILKLSRLTFVCTSHWKTLEMIRFDTGHLHWCRRRNRAQSRSSLALPLMT